MTTTHPIVIYARHPVRGPIAELSNYYRYKSDFVPQAEEILKKYGWALGAFDMPGDSGTVLAPIEEIESSMEVGRLVVSYYRMPSGGQSEVTIYVA